MPRDDIDSEGGSGGGLGRGRAGDATPSPPLARLPARLSTPVVRRGDSVASQFQREILGAASAATTSASDARGSAAPPIALSDDDIEISTPEHFVARGADRENDNDRDEECKRDGDDEAPSAPYATRRRTLSPSQAPLLQVVDDSAISRRDTVSPAALKSLLQSISLDDGSPPAQLRTRHASLSAATATRETASSDSESAQEDQVTPSQFLEATAPLVQTPESARRTRAAKRKEREERTLSPSEALLLTLGDDDDAAPSRRAAADKPTAPAKRRSLSPAGGSRPDTTPQKTNINDSNDSNDNDRETPTRQLRSQFKSRRATLEPTDADDFLSALRDELQTASDREGPGASDAEPSARETSGAKRRQSAPAPLFAADVSPVTRAKSRRATADPSEIVAVAGSGGRDDDSAADNEQPAQRRETLNAEDLHEINVELRLASEDSDDDEEQAAHQTDEHGARDASDERSSRKRQQPQQQPPPPPSPQQNPLESADDSSLSAAGGGGGEGGAKKVRGSPTGSPPREAVVSMASKQAAGLARPQKTPTPRKPGRGDEGGDSDSEGSSRRGRGAAERQSLLAKFSSPPAAQSSRTKTPLRSILSARKAAARPMTTPTKSVNFGPPQGAEFNHGSPSTSMTPMPAKDAKRMFPLDRAVSPPSFEEGEADNDDEDDEETSLNTSLLDEADAIDSDDAEQKEEENGDDDDDSGEDGGDTVEMEVAGLNVSTTRSPDKNHRRFSLRGVSPLDNQANARRWRRSNAGAAVVRSPVSARKLKGIGPGALASISAPPSPATRSVFLSDDAEGLPQSRPAYADSSASSDAGDDMEITGDFSAFVQASGILSASAQKTAAAMPSFRFKGRKKDAESADGDDNTVELGSLGDLVAESAAYDDADPRPTQGGGGSGGREAAAASSHADDEDSDVPALGSLSDLAREGEEPAALPSGVGVGVATLSSAASARGRFNSLHYSQLDEQDVTLGPILEEEEDAANSSAAPSMMSIATSEDESDAEDGERRKSLVVNLSAQFDRVGSGSPTSPESSVTAAELSARIRSPLRQSPRRRGSLAAAAAPAAATLISMEELLATIGPRDDAPTLPDDHFGELHASNSASNATVDAVKRAAVSAACTAVVTWHIDEITAWSAGLSDVLGSLLSEPAPALFSPDVLDAAGAEAVRAVVDLETTRVQSGLCQWRAKMEGELGAKLAAIAGDLEKDVRALKQRVAGDSATRASELGALRELIAREQQMAELLDATDEQQAVRNEYAAAVEALETECAALSLEASVLEDQLRVAETLASEGSLVSADAAAELERQVLRAEELSTIQSSLSVWRVGVATSSHLKLSAQFDDVVLRMDLHVDVVLSDMAPLIPLPLPSQSQSPSSGGFSSDVASTVTLKRRRRSTYLETERDVVRLAQRKLFDPVQLSRFVRTSNSAQHALDQPLGRPRRICALLQELERYVALSFRFLRELRALSAQYAVEFIADESVLWVEFLNFAPAREAKFVVGFAILDEFPFANFETSVHVVHGPVSADAIRSEIDAEVAKQSDYEYISRICERLRNAFVLR
ncbi:hypothetical protein PybrP1_008947 [[Pythium] brassicae (nom. inval.)]|nr:hypothetical protein PybrP1_008947 [[Pythium] brassicae (nom. inval.)]